MHPGGNGERALPEDVQHDVDRVTEVVAAGFQSRLWQQMADELYNYAFRSLCSAMRHTHKLVELTAHSNTPLSLTDDDVSALHRYGPDRDLLAIVTIDIAMETFPQRLKEGGYDPANNPGKNGKYKRLTSYFYGRCGLVLPRTLNNWRRERTDRFLRHAVWMDGEYLAYALGQRGQETVPKDVADLCDVLTSMVNALPPRHRAVWLMTLDGMAQGDIADALGIKPGDVENSRYALRSKVKKLRQAGALVVPPSIETEWARRREQDKRKKKGATR